MKNEWSGFKGKFWGEVFSSPTLRYLFGFYIFSNRHTRIMKKMIKSHLKDDSMLVDLGAGSGYFTILSAKCNRNASITAVDMSDMMLNRLRSSLIKKKLDKNVTILKENIEHTSIAANTADIIIISNVLHELKDPRDIVEEMNRILKPGGIILASEFLDNDFGRKFLSHHEDEVHGPYSEKEMFKYFNEKKYFKKVKIDKHINRLLCIVQK